GPGGRGGRRVLRRHGRGRAGSRGWLRGGGRGGRGAWSGSGAGGLLPGHLVRRHEREAVVAVRAGGGPAFGVGPGADLPLTAVRADGEERHGRLPRVSTCSPLGVSPSNYLPYPAAVVECN